MPLPSCLTLDPRVFEIGPSTLTIPPQLLNTFKFGGPARVFVDQHGNQLNRVNSAYPPHVSFEKQPGYVYVKGYRVEKELWEEWKRQKDEETKSAGKGQGSEETESESWWINVSESGSMVAWVVGSISVGVISGQLIWMYLLK